MSLPELRSLVIQKLSKVGVFYAGLQPNEDFMYLSVCLKRIERYGKPKEDFNRYLSWVISGLSPGQMIHNFSFLPGSLRGFYGKLQKTDIAIKKNPPARKKVKGLPADIKSELHKLKI